MLICILFEVSDYKMYLEEENVDYDLLRDAVCESMDATTKQSSFQMNCPLKSCRSCIAAAASSPNNAVPTAQASNGDRYNQGDQMQICLT